MSLTGLKQFFILIVVFIVILFSYPVSAQEDLQPYYANDYKLTAYWQGLIDKEWVDWYLDYIKCLNCKHDELYIKYTGTGVFRYIENSKVEAEPLIIWFVSGDRKICEPVVVVSSGSLLYDEFCTKVIKSTQVKAFPNNAKRLFMWSGSINEVVNFLKFKEVLPADYNVRKWITPAQLHWEKI